MNQRVGFHWYHWSEQRKSVGKAWWKLCQPSPKVIMATTVFCTAEIFLLYGLKMMTGKGETTPLKLTKQNEPAVDIRHSV